MTTALHFPNPDSLRAALVGDLIPQEVQTKPMRWKREGEGLVILGEPLEPDVLATLAKLGVTSIDQQPERPGLCWAQALPLGPAEPVSRGWFLITSPDKEAIQRLIMDAISLGCQTLLIRYGEPHAVRMMDPPYFLILRAKESEELTVFHQRDDGNWQAAGWSHPFRTIQTSEVGSLSFHLDQRWAQVPTDNWLELNEAISIQLEQLHPGENHGLQSKIPIPLTLVRAQQESRARLWFLPYSQIRSFERWTAALSQNQLQGIQFAILDSAGERHIALRADHLLEPPGDPRAYAPVDEEVSIYLPSNKRLSPPLTIEQLNQTLGGSTGELIWLDDGETTARAQRISTLVFQPLADWVSYVIHTHQEPIKAWMKGIDPLLKPTRKSDTEGLSAEPALPTADRVEPAPQPAAPVTEAPSSPEPPTAPSTRGSSQPASSKAPRPSLKGITLQASQADLASRLEPIEAQLRTLPNDTSLWLTLARIQAEASLEKEAIRSLTRAWWPLSAADRQEAAKLWHQDLSAGAATQTWSAIIAGRADDGADEWLGSRRPGLGVRSTWLARCALLEAGRCDQLALQEEKDYLLERIRHGVSPVLDVPCCLLAKDQTLVTRLNRVQALTDLRSYFAKNPREPHPAEVCPANTERLIEHIFAVGYSLLGDYEAAQSARKSNPSHPQGAGTLSALLQYNYTERAKLALAGRPETVALESSEALEQDLSPIEVFHYGQALDTSLLLDPLRLTDPQGVWLQRRTADDPTEALVDELINENVSINQILGARQGEAVDQLATLLASLDESDSLRSLLRAYVCASVWQRPELAGIAASKARLGLNAATAQDPLERLARELPALLSIGRTPEAEELLHLMEKKLQNRDSKLYIHAALAIGGHDNQALAMAEEATSLLSPDLSISARLYRIRGICEALRYQDIESTRQLLGKLSGQLSFMRDNRISNAYLSAAAIEFSECLVLAVAGRPRLGTPSLLAAEESELRRQLNQDTRTI